MTRIGMAIGIGVLLAALAAGWYGWKDPASPGPVAPAPPVAVTPPPAPAPAPEATPPAVRYPIDPPVTARAPLGDAPTRVTGPANAFKVALDSLMGPAAVLKWMQVDDFARRLVATVDNLERPHAAARLWPVNPMPGRFTPVESPQGLVIGGVNHARYAAFVGLVDTVDSRRAVAVYRQLYPMLQSAYEDLGYPGRHFNDRLVDVIDHLLATPEPAGSLAVHLVEVKGSVPSIRPWVRYEFADPSHEARSAGQKILLRLGPDQRSRLKAKLAEVRALVTQRGTGGT